MKLDINKSLIKMYENELSALEKDLVLNLIDNDFLEEEIAYYEDKIQLLKKQKELEDLIQLLQKGK